MSTGNKIFWIIFIIIFLIVNGYLSHKKSIHHKKIKQAKKIYKNFNSKEYNINENNKSWLFNYLRKIDPFVFEELVLYAFKCNGFKIKRNKKYTGDGGIDGRVKINQQQYLIQVKRYTNYINPSHVEQFAHVCKNQKKLGFFVHTGKTGSSAKEISNNHPNIKIISGDKLVKLLTNDIRNESWTK